MNLIESYKKSGVAESINNPFKSENVDGITIEINPNAGPHSIFEKSVFNADIRFKSGDTTGRHRVSADTLEELLIKIQTCIQSL